MDIHGYPRKNDMDMDMDMDGIFLIHGKPDLLVQSVGKIGEFFKFCRVIKNDHKRC